MAVDFDLNLFTSDPRLLVRGDDIEYERAAVWSGLPQPVAERELAAMTLAGIVERRETPLGITYVPRDGHHVVQLYTALAHGREGLADRHPRMLTRRRLGRTRKVG